MLLTLTLVTGLVDAVSILALGRVFVANMTGNVVFAGFAIVGAPGFSLGASLFALAGFLIGAYGGGFITSLFGHDRALHIRAATGAEFGLLAVALIVAGVSGGAAATTGTPDMAEGAGAFGAGITYVLALVLAIAMGIQNSVARKLAVPDLTTTVLTMTLTGIGADSPVGHRGHVTLIRRLLVLATMLGRRRSRRLAGAERRRGRPAGHGHRPADRGGRLRGSCVEELSRMAPGGTRQARSRNRISAAQTPPPNRG